MEELFCKQNNTALNIDEFDGVLTPFGIESTQQTDTSRECLKFMKGKLDATRMTLESSENNNLALQKQNEKLKNDVEHKSARLQETQHRCEMLLEKCNALQENRDQMEKKIHCMNQRIQDLENELSKGKEQSKCFEWKLECLDEKYARGCEEKDQLNSIFEKSTAKQKALENYVEALDDKIKFYESRDKERIKKIEENNSVSQEKDSLLQERKCQLETILKQKEELQTEVKMMHDKVQDLCEPLQKSHEDYKELEREFRNIREGYSVNYKTWIDERSELTSSMEKCQSDCQRYVEYTEELESKLEEAYVEKNETMKRNRDLKELVAKKDEDLDECARLEYQYKQQVAELEEQMYSQREEIPNLRTLVTREKANNESLVEMCEKKTIDCRKLENVNEEMCRKIANLGVDLSSAKKQEIAANEACKQSSEKASEVDAQMKDLKKQYTEKVKLAVELDCNLREAKESFEKALVEIVDKNGEYAKLKSQYESMLSQHEGYCELMNENEKKICTLTSNIDILKEELWELRDNKIEIESSLAVAKETLYKTGHHCSVLIDKNKSLCCAVEELKEDKIKRENQIANHTERITRMEDAEMLASKKIAKLIENLEAVKKEKEGLTRKVEDMEKEHKESLKEIEKQCQERFHEKVNECEKQTKKKEANEILMRKMDEKLKQKEIQLEVTTNEAKRMLVRCSDLKNDKIRCEKKIESLLIIEKELSAKSQRLEPRVQDLEIREQVLLTKLREQREENKTINAKWENVASEGLLAIRKEFCG